MIFTTCYDSPIGRMTLASDGENLIGLWIDDYFSGKRPSISDLPLAPRGSKFRKNVWGILCDIPYGQTTTYGKIAMMIASKECKDKISAQAIGGAVGHNPISIIIPCHRVIGINGDLTGYAGGIDKKIKLLKNEGININEELRRVVK